MTVEIAGSTFLVSGAGPPVKVCLSHYGPPANGARGSADVTIDVQVAAVGQRTGGAKVFSGGSVWQLQQDDGHQILRLFFGGETDRAYRVARSGDGFSNLELVIDPEHQANQCDVDPLETPLGELLLVRQLMKSGGALVHGSAVVREDGRAMVFPGRSGDGKSTMAGLWQQTGCGRMLSDDRVALRFVNGRLVVFPIPWAVPQVVGTEGYPVAGMLVLRHGEMDQVEPLSGAAGVSALFPCVFTPFRDATTMEQVCDTLAGLAAAVPCGLLRFRPLPAAVETVERWLAGHE